MTALLAFALIFAIATLWGLYLFARRNRYSPKSREQAEAEMEDFNVAALKRLLSKSEQLFLKASVPPKRYRKIQRKRMRVALAYLSELNRLLSCFEEAEGVRSLRRTIARARFCAIRGWLFPDRLIEVHGITEAFIGVGRRSTVSVPDRSS
jgi:hypothetical protein